MEVYTLRLALLLLAPTTFCHPLRIYAQPAFLKNPDIVWAATLEQDWVVDIPSWAAESDSGLTTLKLLRTRRERVVESTRTEIINFESRKIRLQYQDGELPSPYLADLVYQAAFQRQLPVFQDAGCNIPLDFTGTGYQDTIVTFDPETYQERMVCIAAQIDPVSHFKGWRLRQILAYHQESATWSTTVEAIAPLVTERNNRRDSIGLRPLFWFRPDGKRPDLLSNDIIWVKQAANKQFKTRVPLSSKQVLKGGDSLRLPVVHLFQLLKTRMKIPFYDALNDRPLSPEDRLCMLGHPDTAAPYIPTTYEEYCPIIQRHIQPIDVHQLRLLQTWYWDEHRHRLAICLDAVAPLVDVFDSEGNFRYIWPLFYRRAGR